MGVTHPDAVVEFASFSSVEPMDDSYFTIFPREVFSVGLLSAVQNENVLRAGSRAEFIVLDWVGADKRKTMASLICEGYLRERKRADWISVLSDLKYDAERDLVVVTFY